ncbi:MAG TPA: response regulator transcription factor [Gemmatimonadales bacterium]
MARVRVLLADDHPPLLAAIRRLLAPEFEVVGEAHNGEEAVQMARDLHPDVVVTDLAMPRKGGLDAIRQISANKLAPAIVVLTVLADSAVVDAAVAAGARAYVLKSQAGVALLPAISAALAGRSTIPAELPPAS